MRGVSAMRGDEQLQAGSIVVTTLEDVVPADHPLGPIRARVDAALAKMSPALAVLNALTGWLGGQVRTSEAPVSHLTDAVAGTAQASGAPTSCSGRGEASLLARRRGE